MAKVNSVRNFKAPTIHLGGKLRKIQFDMNAFAELEDKYGSVQAAFEALEKGRLKDIRNVLWAGLIHEEAELDEVTGEPIRYKITPYEVGKWINTPTLLREVNEKLALALAGDLPEVQEAVQKAKAEIENKVVLPEGVKLATVIESEEDKKEAEKND